MRQDLSPQCVVRDQRLELGENVHRLPCDQLAEGLPVHIGFLRAQVLIQDCPRAVDRRPRGVGHAYHDPECGVLGRGNNVVLK